MRKIIGLILVVMVFTSCRRNEVKKMEHEEFIFGTMLRFVIYTNDEKLVKKTLNEAITEMKRIDKKYNSKVNGSIIDIINNSKKKIRIDEETYNIFNEIFKISRLSNGDFDITIEPIVKLWDFGNMENNSIPKKEVILEKLEFVNYKDVKLMKNWLQLGENQRIDTGAFIKGYAIKKAKEIFEKNGIDNAFISAISSIETIGDKGEGKKWRIGIQNPENPREVLKVALLDGQAMGVSGDYQTFIEIDGKKYHHLLNPHTGFPFEENKMVVVIGKDAFESDLLSTALFGKKKDEIFDIIENFQGVEVLIVDKNNNIYMSTNMNQYIKEE